MGRVLIASSFTDFVFDKIVAVRMRDTVFVVIVSYSKVSISSLRMAVARDIGPS